MITAKPYDRLCPGAGIELAATHVPPKDISALIRQFSREGVIKADIPVGDELLDLLAGKHGLFISGSSFLFWDVYHLNQADSRSEFGLNEWLGLIGSP